jgi:HSP20 family protein
MHLVRWDPFQLMAMSDQLNRRIHDSHPTRTADSPGAWAPAVDIFEKKDDLVIRAEIPGVQKEDVGVEIENGMLTLRGERRIDTDVVEENVFRMERAYGAFTRSFTLPKTVDGARVTATYKDGVLEVIVPKAEAAKSKKIEVKAA